MTMFKFRRARQQARAARGAAAESDDDEPMTPFPKRPTRGGAGGALPAYDGRRRQMQQKWQPRPASLGAHRKGRGAGGSDAETETTEAWTTDAPSSPGGNDSVSSGSSFTGDSSGASGDYTSGTGSSSGYSERDEETATHDSSNGSAGSSESGTADDSYSEEGGILFTSVDPKRAHQPQTTAKTQASIQKKRPTGGEPPANKRGMPPPPPRSGEAASEDHRQWPGNGLPGWKPKNLRGSKKVRAELAKSASSRSARSAKSAQSGQSEEETTNVINANLTSLPLPPNQDREMKLKPPSMRGGNPKAHLTKTAKGGAKGARQRHRSLSSDRRTAATGLPAATSRAASVPKAREGDAPGNQGSPQGQEQAETEAAAMQQLAYLVVSLRSDLREANAAREELESKVQVLEAAQKQGTAASKAKDGKDSSKELAKLEKENAALRADVGAFLAAQDELKGEVAQLREDKGSLNDMLARLKREASVERSGSRNPAPSVPVGEKTDVDQLEEKLREAEAELERTEGELAEAQTHTAALEEALKAKEDEVKNTRAEASAEGNQLALLRGRLHQAERQRDEAAEKNAALDGVMLGLKKRVEGMLTERRASAEELAAVRAENERMAGELKSRSAAAVAKEASDADTVLNLQRTIAGLQEAAKGDAETRATLEARLAEVEDERAALEEDLGGSGIADLERELAAAKEALTQTPESSSVESDSGSNSESEANLQRSIDDLNLEREELATELEDMEVKLNELEQAKGRLEDELEAAKAKHAQAVQCQTALAERNAKLSSENDDLSTQIKVLTIEKKVAGEEIETLKAMKTIADEDQEEALLRKEETRQEVDDMQERLAEARRASSEKIVRLQKQMVALQDKNEALEEDLEESSDAIAVLREALTEVEEGKGAKDAALRELRAALKEKETALNTVEATKEKLQSDHQVNVDTIATLQKMIASLESSKEDMEEELNQGSRELLDLREKLWRGESRAEVTELEDKLRRAEERNGVLDDRIRELGRANRKMKDQVKDLGESLAKLSATKSQSLAVMPVSPSAAAQDLVTTDPVASCDALISELKSQIHSIVSMRDAALEEVEHLKSDGASVAPSRCSQDDDSHSTMPPPGEAAETKPVGVESVDGEAGAPPTPAPRDEPTHKSEETEDEDDHKTRATLEKSVAASTILTPMSRGSSLLEAAKKLCDQLDEKRSREGSERSSAPPMSGEPQANEASNEEEEPIKDVEDEDIDDNVSRKEFKEDAPPEEDVKPQSPLPEERMKKDEEPKKSSTKSKGGRFDIDQLTSIYFEKCGMSVSKFSDLSSDSSSFRRRKDKGHAGTVTKKVKICRNGVFMGTYEGDLNKEGQRHGFGVLLCDNGNSYEGEWNKDKRDGLGIARYSSGDVYDGQWVRGKRQGHGVMYIEAGDTYIGSWNNGLKHGAGTYHWSDGEVDVSWYQEDRRVGEGVRWNASRSKAYRLIRGTKKEELSLDEAYVTAEKLGLNLEKFDSGAP
ncbi:hypothetical protein ACHAXT_004097 [Thalassiosira profunda]